MWKLLIFFLLNMHELNAQLFRILNLLNQEPAAFIYFIIVITVIR